MSWTIERRGRVAVVTMNTNPVNAQNRAFFADLHEAFDRLERDHPDSPVVLTGTGTRFSAGLDLGEHFPLFAGDEAAVASWFQDYRATNMRLFTYPRPTVAAVNGHAFAGGLITAAVCDRRVAVDEGARFGINEVPIGIPMPAVYLRMLQYAWGEPVAPRACLQGEVFSTDRGARVGPRARTRTRSGAARPRDRHRRADPRGLPRRLRLHQTRPAGPSPARHRRVERSARPGRTRRRHDQRTVATGPPPLLGATQGQPRPLVIAVDHELPRWLIWRQRPFPDANLLLVDGRQPALVDSGFIGHADETAAWVDAHTTTLHRVVNTHWHADHVGGNALLQSRGAGIAASTADADALARRDPGCCLAEYLDQPVAPYTVDERLDDGAVLRLGDTDWEVIRTPGHTPGHLALWEPDQRLLIVGDALSDYDVGWVNTALDGPDATRTALASLRRLAALPARVVLPAHGPIPTDPQATFAAALRRAQRLVDDPDGAVWYGGAPDLRLRVDDSQRYSRRRGRTLPACPRLGQRRGTATGLHP